MLDIAVCCRHDYFGIKNKRTSVGQEVLAGIMGWQTVVSSSALYASLFVGDDEDTDQGATTEMFMVVGGLSTIVFGLAFNVPFIVAPSVLYASRAPGVSVGGHLATQAVANFAAAVFLFVALDLSFVSCTPTALRLGAGCGISMLIGVLGMRGVGLLTADSFAFQPFTWQSVVGLAVLTAACIRSAGISKTRKWMLVVGVPLALNTLVYAMFDRSKFQGYNDLDRPPLSGWGAGSFGDVDFSRLFEAPGEYLFSVVRTFMSVVINICSILLVLIDAVCLEDIHSKIKSSTKVDFSRTIGGTKKFRSMACSIPLMSSLGNLVGVTSQAAFVQSMIIIFAGGKTGLSAAVTGSLMMASTVLRPLLPVLVPGHISGALAVVITLRFFTVVRLIDVSHRSNLLMFGTSILLIPFSFDFVDSVCIAVVLGFLCETGDKFILRQSRDSSKVGVSDEREIVEELLEDGSLATEEKSHTQGARRHSWSQMPPNVETVEVPMPQKARGSFSRALLYLHSSHGSGSGRLAQKSRKRRRRRSASERVGYPVLQGDSLCVHWGIALAAILELILTAISDKVQGEE